MRGRGRTAMLQKKCCDDCNWFVFVAIVFHELLQFPFPATPSNFPQRSFSPVQETIAHVISSPHHHCDRITYRIDPMSFERAMKVERRWQWTKTLESSFIVRHSWE